MTDVQAMLALYGVADEAEIARLTAAARGTWLRPEAIRTRMPFGDLMDEAASSTLTAEELAAELEEPVQRAHDAIEAVRRMTRENGGAS